VPNGKVVTFYSYKGGTGRTMALANVAWILAANGHCVLAVRRGGVRSRWPCVAPRRCASGRWPCW